MRLPKQWQWFVAVPVLLMALAVFALHLKSKNDGPPQEFRDADRQASMPMDQAPSQVDIDEAPHAAALSAQTGDTHDLAVSSLVELAKRRRTINPEDAQILLAFISAPKPGDLADDEWEERVNVILNLLRQQSEVPGLADYLLTTADKNPSRVLRLYALQHISLWYAKATEEAEKQRMISLLETLATREEEETAGCAVPMLSDLQREGMKQGAPVIDDERIAKASHHLVANTTAPQDVRISAIHACVDRMDAAPLPELRKIAADDSLVSTLRKAAICAIGQLGDEEDLKLLESLPQADGNLSMAVNPARKALAARTSGSTH